MLPPKWCPFYRVLDVLMWTIPQSKGLLWKPSHLLHYKTAPLENWTAHTWCNCLESLPQVNDQWQRASVDTWHAAQLLILAVVSHTAKLQLCCCIIHHLLQYIATDSSGWHLNFNGTKNPCLFWAHFEMISMCVNSCLLPKKQNFKDILYHI